MYANSSSTLFTAHNVNIISVYIPTAVLLYCYRYKTTTDIFNYRYYLHSQTNFASTSANEIRFIQNYVTLFRGESLRRRWDAMTFQISLRFSFIVVINSDEFPGEKSMFVCGEKCLLGTHAGPV